MSKEFSANIHDPNHTVDDYDLYFNGEPIETGGGGSSTEDINLSSDRWEIGAVSGTLNRSYYQNQTANNARIRLIYPAYTNEHAYTFTMNFGSEWTAQYAMYDGRGKCVSQFTTVTEDTMISADYPYIGIVLRHTDGTTEMNLSDIDIMQPKLIY